MRKIDPKSLVLMDRQAGEVLRVELSYAAQDNLLFGESIYRPEAQLWLHESLGSIVIKAAWNCFKTKGLRFILYDGLRTTDAQEKMLQTRRVKENPHWLKDPPLLSKPGSGGHPRGMAIDIGLETLDGQLVDMGTTFDYLAGDSGPDKNPAHREYKNLSPEVQANRAILTDAMVDAARELSTPLIPLPQEWWDFRLTPEIYNSYEPLSDADLPPMMRMVSG